jgi:putative Mn2+ efflux pump MntP
MAAQRTVFRSSKSIAGAVLLVLGTFILYENLAGAVARLNHVLNNSSAPLGVLPAAVLTVSQAAHAYGLNHQRFLQCLFHQMLVSSWPLLLIIFGAVLSRDTFADKFKARPRK